MNISRKWAMPSGETLSIPPISDFVQRWTRGAEVIVDPFARNSLVGTHRNDLSPDTAAEWHMDAEDFCLLLRGGQIAADVAIFDPPYSPRQISELYQSIGREVTAHDTQNAWLYKRVRDALFVKPGGIVLSFGWNSAGMGRMRGYEIEEILIIAHGGAHNDTICMAERHIPNLLSMMEAAE